jgi:hypothetical protein
MKSCLGFMFSAGAIGLWVGSVGVGCADADPAPNVVAQGSTLGLASYVALHGDHVYWATDHDIRSAPVIGGAAPTVLAPDQNNIVDFVVDGSAAYWAVEGMQQSDGLARDGAILMKPLTGGPIVVVANQLDRPYAIAIDGGQVYCTGGRPPDSPTAASAGYVLSVPVGGGVPTVRVSGLSFVGAIAARDGTVVYSVSDDDFSRHTRLVRLDPSGESTVLATMDRSVTAIAFADGNVYWTESDTSAIDVSLDDGYVRSVPLAGGTLSTLAADQFQPHSLVASGDQLLWANFGRWDVGGPGGNGAIYSEMKAGPAPTPVVSRQQNVASLAVDQKHLAWIEDRYGTDDLSPVGSLLVVAR